MTHPITTAARGYLGVPFSHQGRSRLGLDCLGLLVMVARDMGLHDAAAQDRIDYAHYPDEQRLKRGLTGVMQLTDRMREGCVALMHIDGHARHLGIIGDHANGYSLIHAYAPARKVVEHRLDEQWYSKIVGFYWLRETCC